MLILVYGEDTFRASEKVKELKEAFKKKFDPTGMNISLFVSDKNKLLDHNEVLQAARSLPFLGTRRLILVRDVIQYSNKDNSDAWFSALKDIPESTIFILWESADDIEKKNLYKKIKDLSNTFLYPFPFLKDAALEKWTALRIKQSNGTIEPGALRDLVQRVGPDLWQMTQEIIKLAAFSDGKTITLAMVNENVRANAEGEIFALMDAISHKRTREALPRLAQERLFGSDDFQLIGMLARQIRILLGARFLLDQKPYVSNVEAASELGLHPFVTSKAIVQAKRFTLDNLKKAHDFFFEYDIKIKSGDFPADLAVDLLVYEIMK